MADRSETVAVLGASPKPARYANQAIRLLLEEGAQKGFQVCVRFRPGSLFIWFGQRSPGILYALVHEPERTMSCWG